MKTTWILMNKPVYLGLSILEISKIVICYMDADTFIVYIKLKDIYVDSAKDAETRFDTSNYEVEKPLPKGKNKNVIGLIKDELFRKIMTNDTKMRLH